MAQNVRAPDAREHRSDRHSPPSPRLISIHRRLPLLLALAQTVAYVGLGAIAYLLYPVPFSPLHNTLSELGNPALNPHGSKFYLLGCLIGGALMASFFLSLGRFQRPDRTRENLMLRGVQAFGVVAGLALALLALNPNNEAPGHHIALGLLANGFLAAVVLSLFTFGQLHRSTPAVRTASILSVAAIGLMFALPAAHWVEFLSAFMSQVYAWTVGFRASKVPIA